jgi:hypothetical protein
VDVDGPTRLRVERFPETMVCETGKGVHYYFTLSEGATIRNSAGKIAENVDVRGISGYVLIPPSVHPSGHRYIWREIENGWNVAPAPRWILSKAQAPNGAGANGDRNPPGWQSPLLQGVTKGERNQTACKLAGRYLAKRLDSDEVLALLTGWNLNNKPPLSSEELTRVVDSVTGLHKASITARVAQTMDMRKKLAQRYGRRADG